jgi:hypothetical protein
MADGKEWRGPERRTDVRLRALIDELRSELRDTRYAMEFLRERVSTLSVELEELKRLHNERRASTAAAGENGVSN